MLWRWFSRTIRGDNIEALLPDGRGDDDMVRGARSDSLRKAHSQKKEFPIIQLPEYLNSTVLFARQNTSYTHTDGNEFPSLSNARSLVS